MRSTCFTIIVPIPYFRHFQQLTVLNINTGLLKMTVGVLTTCHTQYTWDRSM